MTVYQATYRVEPNLKIRVRPFSFSKASTTGFPVNHDARNGIQRNSKL